MKTSYRLMAMALAAVALNPFMGCSCDPDEEFIPKTVVLPDDAQGKVLDELSQKEYLEEVGRELLSKVSASDFDNLAEVLNYASDEYVDNRYYDDDDVEEWYRSALAACDRGYDGDVLKRLIVASNFTGKFEATSRGWRHTGEGSTLQFTFDDRAGRACVLTLSASNSYVPLHHDEMDDYDYRYTSRYGYQKEKSMEITLGVPQQMSVVLTQAGNRLLEVKVTTAISGTSGEVTLDKGVYAATVEATVGPYTLTETRGDFNPASEAYGSVTLKKGSEVLVTAQAVGNGRLSERTYHDDYEDWTEVELVQGGECQARVDVLGKVSMRGYIDEVKKFADYLDKADGAYDDEDRFNRYLDRANEQLHVGVYYHGDNVRQADLLLLPDVDRWRGYYYDYEEWCYVPGVLFADGSSYQLGDFFDDKLFDKLFDAFDDLLRDFDDLLDE